ncbi:hypothetical protein [Psychrobacter sp. P11G3]|uniref:hypothetical protein n=1 Tax=Psychrobacter sp. P11G3 TaxID=1699623 RepID=UPI00070CA876|nr:hypothetical protein [Psychrobacter sp. P11G3]KRG32828.1 hypothetical protein AK824_10110 [Psychrobacter sp. P11G3]
MTTLSVKKSRSFYVLTAALFFWIGVTIFGIYFWEYDDSESLISFLYFLSACILFILASYRERQLEKKRIYDNNLLSINSFSAQLNAENEQLTLVSDKNFLWLSTFTFYAILILLILSVGLLLYGYINGDLEYGIFVFIYLELFFMHSINKNSKQIKQRIYDKKIS